MASFELMKQAALALNLDAVKTRKQWFLEQTDKVVRWDELVILSARCCREGMTGRPPFAPPIMLRTHFIQQWFCLADQVMEEAFLGTPRYREFAQLP